MLSSGLAGSYRLKKEPNSEIHNANYHEENGRYIKGPWEAEWVYQSVGDV